MLCCFVEIQVPKTFLLQFLVGFGRVLVTAITGLLTLLSPLHLPSEIKCKCKNNKKKKKPIVSVVFVRVFLFL